MTTTQHFTAMVSAFKKLSHARAKIVLEQTSALIGTFEELHDFMARKVMLITQLRDAAQVLVDGEGRNTAIKSSAEDIRKQIAAEKTEHQKKSPQKPPQRLPEETLTMWSLPTSMMRTPIPPMRS